MSIKPSAGVVLSTTREAIESSGGPMSGKQQRICRLPQVQEPAHSQPAPSWSPSVVGASPHEAQGAHSDAPASINANDTPTLQALADDGDGGERSASAHASPSAAGGAPDPAGDPWARSVHKPVRTGAAPKVKGSAETPGWKSEVDPSQVYNKASWSVSRAGAEGRVQLMGDDKKDAPKGGVSARVDRNGVHGGLYLENPDMAGKPKGELSMGDGELRADVGVHADLDNDVSLQGSGRLTIGERGIGSRNTIGARAKLPSTDLTQEGSHRALGAGRSQTAFASASSSQQVDIRPQRPVQQGSGGWTVAYAMPVTKSSLMAAGLTSTESLGTTTGDTLGGSASMGGQVVFELNGNKHFDTKAQAEAWYTLPMPDGSELNFLSPSAVAGLEEGETVGGQISADVSAAGSVSAPVGNLSAGVTAGVGAGVSITGLGDGWVQVTRHAQANAGAAAGLGTAGLDVGVQGTLGQRGEDVWTLKTGTAGPDAAYRQLLMGGTPTEGPGVQRGEQRDISTDGVSANANVGFIGYHGGQQRTDTTTTHPDGSQRHAEDGRTTSKASAHRFVKDYVASIDADQGTLAFTDTDADGSEVDSRVLAVGRVKNGSAQGNAEDIGRITGLADFDRKPSGPATPGSWDVAMDYGPGSLDRLAKAAQNYDESADVVGLPYGVQTFLHQMRNAGTDRAAQRQAVQDFGQSGGDVDLLLGRLLGKGGPGVADQVHLGLEGSETWVGVEGHRAVERKLEKATTLFEQGSFGDQAELIKVLANQENRLLDLNNQGAYPEVADSIRSAEIRRTEKLISRCKALLAMIPNAERQAAGALEVGPVADAWAEVYHRRTAMEAVLKVLDQEWDRHGIDAHGGGEGTLYKEYGDRAFLDIPIGDGVGSKAYREAREQRDFGQDAHNAAIRAELTLRREANVRTMEHLAEVAATATSSYSQAAIHYSASATALASIETSQPR
ncbi:MAG: hypothetical protein AB8H79_03630 [Myxococcota bacterium]